MRLQYVTLVLASCLLYNPPACSQDSSGNHSAFTGVLSDDFTAFWSDAGSIFTAPLRFDGHDWVMTNLTLAGTTLLFTTDASVRSFAQRNHSDLADHLADVGEQYGRNINVLLISGGLYLGGLFLQEGDVRTTGRMVFESALFAGTVTTVLKSLSGRSRPALGEGELRFRGMQFSDERLSLPSGHATLAFAVSSVLSNRIHNTFASVGLYALATVTAWSRVYHDDHWLSDTFLGAVIGTTVGCTISAGKRSGGGTTSFRVTPLPSGVRVEFVL